MSDNVNHPKHYTSHPSGVECIEITEHHCFCIGNAIKYLWRAGIKNEGSTNEVQDVQKALWYIERHLTGLRSKPRVEQGKPTQHPSKHEPNAITGYYSEHVAKALKHLWHVGVIDMPVMTTIEATSCQSAIRHLKQHLESLANEQTPQG